MGARTGPRDPVDICRCAHPQAQTVGVHRIELETGSIELPEDEGVAAHARSAEPFVRDVFLLGVLVYELLEGRELERLNDVPVYDGTSRSMSQRLHLGTPRPWTSTLQRATETHPRLSTH